ncbi:MAG TPA: thermonuclease family protein, partial [Rhodobacteraceae bacterium]|nr:thermonuclease family protein [Paracoccaceae bacterium]
DTPEVYSPRCRDEKLLGERATRFLRAQIAGTTSMDFRFRRQDRYGRDLVRMRIDGRDVAGLMVSNGLAVRYTGGRRINWCSRLATT